MKKYVVCGDWVYSKADEDEHYVRASELVRLYGLRMEDCILCESSQVETIRGLPKYLPILRPQYDGDYQLPMQYPEVKIDGKPCKPWTPK